MADILEDETDESEDSEIIAKRLTLLCDSGEVVSLIRASDGRRWSAVLISHQAKKKKLSWQGTSSKAIPPFKPGDELWIEGSPRAGYLVGSGMICQKVEPAKRKKTATISTGWPERIELRQARREWRAQVPSNTANVVVRVSQPQSPPASGTLRDLSVGGCRIALARPSRTLQKGATATFQIQFKNGETVDVHGLITNATGGGKEIGVNFIGISDELSRGLWKLCCEIDREFERLRKERSELRQLDPSTLFIAGGKHILGNIA